MTAGDTTNDIPNVFAQARAAQAKGDMAAAKGLYARILAIKPNLAEVHFNLAQIAASGGNMREAMDALRTAAGLKPSEPAIWAAWIDLAKAAKDTRELRDIGGRLTKSGVPKAALAQLQTRLGGVLSAEEKALLAGIKTNKSSPAAHRKYADYLMAKGRAGDAVPVLQRAVKLAPKLAAARSALGYALLRVGEHEAARVAFDKAANLGPLTAQIARGQGAVALAQKDDAAVGYFDAAMELQTPDVDLHMQRAAAYRAARMDDDALAAYDAALTLAPDRPAVMAEKAGLLQNIGEVAQARDLIATALKHEPENGSLFMLYASAGKLAADDPLMARAKRLYDGGHKDRSLAFAVSKAAEAAGENPFAYWTKANALTREAFPYNFDADAKAVGRVQEAYVNRNPRAWAKVADTDPAPIFVTGMPRSGTTLVEQIIAAHSDVASAGEVGILGRYFRDPSGVPDMDLIRARYWQLLQTRFPGVARITDKSIGTYVHIGFIKAVLPNAKIVVVRRDPRDNAVSIFKNVFAAGQHRYSNDLADIARFIKLFEAQIAFWLEEAPDAFATIRYEDLIAQPEATSRQLISDVGLNWQEACLSFHQSRARVDTLSNVQVRQPIYASSVGAWEKYRSELAPFLETYGPIQD